MSTKTAGGYDAWWEVLSYIPGDWEETLDPLVEAGEKASLKREQVRFGV